VADLITTVTIKYDY